MSLLPWQQHAIGIFWVSLIFLNCSTLRHSALEPNLLETHVLYDYVGSFSHNRVSIHVIFAHLLLEGKSEERWELFKARGIIEIKPYLNSL